MTYGEIGVKEDLQLVGVVDASYKTDEKSVGGIILMITNKNLMKASPIMWKSKQIERVCHSSKDVEKLTLSKMIESATYAARQMKTLVYGDHTQRIPVKIFTDSEPTLESVASIRQIERNTLSITVQELKDKLMQGEVTSYQWISTSDMWSDTFTKEMKNGRGISKNMTE